MSPNLEKQIPESVEIDTSQATHDDILLNLTPLSDLSASTSLSEENPSIESEQNDIEQDVVEVSNQDFRNFVALEYNIRELLIRVSNTERLETVTQIRLRVIAREVALQQLGIYLPALRELTLDGSVVTSLRDLGYGLKNLKILRVNRCQLPCIDGVLGLESLEELYAAHNGIKDLSPCAFLTNLKILDIRKNCIKRFRSMSFLNFCQELTDFFVDGNEVLSTVDDYRNVIKGLLPSLKTVDNVTLSALGNVGTAEKILNDEEETDDSEREEQEQESEKLFSVSTRFRRISDNPNGFIVRFPPKVFEDNVKK